MGTYLFENGKSMDKSPRNMLDYYAFACLGLLREKYIFQHDCAPAIYSNRATSYSSNMRPSKWIGRVDQLLGQHALPI